MSAWRRDPRRRATPGGLVAAIGLVLVVELVLGTHEPRFKSPGVAEYYSAGRSLPDASRYEVVCLGDSLAKDGLLPRVIEAGTGLRTYNFAISGGRPPVTFYMLRRLLGSGAELSALVVDFHATVAAADFRDNLPGLAEVVSLGDVLDLAWTSGDFRVGGMLASARLLPSVRNRVEIRSCILASLHGAGEPSRDAIRPLLRNLAENAGALVLPVNQRSATTTEFWNEGANVRRPWSSDPVNTAFIRRTLALAEDHGIPVFWLIPPIHPRVQSARERLGLDASYARFVLALQAGHTNVTVIDARHAAIDPTFFVDATHLDRRGAHALSAGVSSILRHCPRGTESPRWLELSPCLVPSFEAP